MSTTTIRVGDDYDVLVGAGVTGALPGLVGKAAQRVLLVHPENAALAPLVGGAAAGLARRGGDRRTPQGTTPPVGGMGMGAMGARAGTMSRGMASGRAGARRLATPRLDGDDDGDAAARAMQAEVFGD